MFADREPNKPPKMIPSLEAVVPVGAMVIPLGGSETDGRGARVVANEVNDVRVGAFDDLIEVPLAEIAANVDVVPFVGAKDVIVGAFDELTAVPPVEAIANVDVVPLPCANDVPDCTEDTGRVLDVVDCKMELAGLEPDPIKADCAPVLNENGEDIIDPEAVPWPEPVMPNEDPDAHVKDQVGDEEAEETGLPEDAVPMLVDRGAVWELTRRNVRKAIKRLGIPAISDNEGKIHGFR